MTTQVWPWRRVQGQVQPLHAPSLYCPVLLTNVSNNMEIDVSRAKEVRLKQACDGAEYPFAQTYY